MANIRENKRNGKVISYRFTACLGRDANDKQIRRYTTWEIPDGLTPAKAKKAAERAADVWEQEVKAEHQKEKELGQAYTLSPEKRRDSFSAFINDVWFHFLFYVAFCMVQQFFIIHISIPPCPPKNKKVRSPKRSHAPKNAQLRLLPHKLPTNVENAKMESAFLPK